MPRATQTEEFWRDEFEVTEADETALQEHFFQVSRPLPTDEIGSLLMAARLGGGQDNRAVADGRYNPSAQYEVGQTIIFPQLDDALGEIVAVREGRNARYGPFEVLGVRFGGHAEPREFAANLRDFALAHSAGADEPLLAPEELTVRYGGYVQEAVLWALERSPNFVRQGNTWLPSVMLVRFHEGHANIAEAMIDMMGTSMSPEELLTELPITDDASAEVKRFSLNHALAQDGRFANVGSDEQPQWFLPRLG